MIFRSPLSRVGPLRHYSSVGVFSSEKSSGGGWRHWWWSGSAAATTLALLSSGAAVNACGIFGFVGGDKEEAVDYLLEGLDVIQNRGYDSAGIATINAATNEIVVSKFANIDKIDSIQALKSEAPLKHAGGSVGIAHTRWATHGQKAVENAHPHWDCKKRIAIVHNGTIGNYRALKQELLQKGVVFASQSDSEIIAQLIGLYLDEGLDEKKAFSKAMERIEGSWGVAMISKNTPNRIIVARNGSPFFIGIGQDKMFVSSDQLALSRHTSDYIELSDGEIAEVNSSKMNLDLSRLLKSPIEDIPTSPSPYAHWILKEIYDMPEASARALNYGARLYMGNTVRLGGLDENRDMLLKIQNLIITGSGSSYHAGLYCAAIMRWLGAFRTVQVFDASEIGNAEIPTPHSHSGILGVSMSGETTQVIEALKIAENLGVPRFSVVNTVGSNIATLTNCGAYINAGQELSVVSTKGFVSEVLVSSLVGIWFAQNRRADGDEFGQGLQRRRKLIESLHKMPIYVGMTLNENSEKIKEIAGRFKDCSHFFVLGKGFSEPIAYEGAQKLKEITYIHAEGYSGGALKHGPFALIESGTPIIMLILDDVHSSLMRTAAEEVRARGAKTIVITDNPRLASGVADEIIVIPSNGPLTALLGIVPIQLLAYEIALLKNLNPDKPRNLKKTIT